MFVRIVYDAIKKKKVKLEAKIMKKECLKLQFDFGFCTYLE